MNKINNGYIVCIHYYNSETRHIGPYPSTTKAFYSVQETWKLRVFIPKEETNKKRSFRPVIGRKYKVMHDRDGIVAISISVLEINLNAPM